MDIPEKMNDELEKFINEDWRFTNKTGCIRFILGDFLAKRKK